MSRIWHLNFDFDDLTFRDPSSQMATLDKKMLQLGPPPRKHLRLILTSFSSELEQYKVSVLPPNGPFQNKIQPQQILELWGTLQGCKHKLPEKLKKQICFRFLYQEMAFTILKKEGNDFI